MKIVLVTGIFDVFHHGHFRLLSYAKSLGQKLVVGIVSDDDLSGKGNFSDELNRLEVVKSCVYVDEVEIINKGLKKFILTKKPDLIVKGNEFKNLKNPENEYIKKINCKIVFGSGSTVFDTLPLKSYYEKLNLNYNISSYNKFVKKHNINLSDVPNIVKSFSNLKVLVIGDLIIDEYIFCDPLGMSREDPSVVFTPKTSRKFVGGSGVVAAHAASFGCEVNYFTVSGNDQNAKFAERFLNKFKIKNHIIRLSDRPTTLKQRFKSDNKTVFKLSKLNSSFISHEVEKEILKKIKKIINNVNIIIYSDFSYGCLTKNLIKNINTLARENNIVISSDSQSSSQIGDLKKFNQIELVTPTEYEARVSLDNFEDGLVVLSDKLSKEIKVKNILLKLGKEGVLIYNNNGKEYVVDNLESFVNNPIDENGAGDSMMVASVLSYYINKNIWISAFLGSIAAAIQISKVGNSPILVNDFLSLIKRIQE